MVRWRELRHRFGKWAVVIVAAWVIRELIGLWGDAEFLAEAGRLDWLWAVVRNPWTYRLLLVGAALFILATFVLERKPQLASASEGTNDSAIDSSGAAPTSAPRTGRSRQTVAAGVGGRDAELGSWK